MRIGIDFDNTIVCYDEVFTRIARARGLIPDDLPSRKSAVRDHLRATGREHLWTELQGHVYGPGLKGAPAFTGFWDFVRACNARGIEVRVVSHKTRTPFLGPTYDLHAAARDWLAASAAVEGAALDCEQDLYLELTKEAKLARIGALGCDWFVDDLPEFLTEPGFPAGVRRILFDPSGTLPVPDGTTRLTAWMEITAHLLGDGR